jgi:hypothetical protein
MVYTGQLPSMGGDIKTTVVEIRKTLEANLKDYL